MKMNTWTPPIRHLSSKFQSEEVVVVGTMVANDSVEVDLDPFRIPSTSGIFLFAPCCSVFIDRNQDDKASLSLHLKDCPSRSLFCSSLTLFLIKRGLPHINAWYSLVSITCKPHGVKKSYKADLWIMPGLPSDFDLTEQARAFKSTSKFWLSLITFESSWTDSMTGFLASAPPTTMCRIVIASGKL